MHFGNGTGDRGSLACPGTGRARGQGCIARSGTVATLAATAALLLIGTARAVDYTWVSPTSGDWTTNGNWDPSSGSPTTGDTALIDATGPAYTVTVNAARTIGGLTLASADATLLASSTLTSTASPVLTSGTLSGSLRFNSLSGTATPLNLDISAIATSGATSLILSNTVGAQAGTFTAPATLPANLTMTIGTLNTTGGRGIFSVNSADAFTNSGTFVLRTNYYASGTDDSSLHYTIASGTLVNQGRFEMQQTYNQSGAAAVAFSGDLRNDAAGTVVLNSTSPLQSTSGKLNAFSKFGVNIVNRGSFTVSGSSGAKILGSGTDVGAVGSSFVQDTAGASLTASRLIVGGVSTSGVIESDPVSSVRSTFSVTAGTVSGTFWFYRTAVTFAGATVAGPTDITWAGEGSDAQRNTWTGNVGSNMSFTVASRGSSEGGYLDVLESFTNSGTVTVRTIQGAFDPNGAYGWLRVLGSGTLTNASGLTMEIGGPAFNNGATTVRFTGNLVNDTSGTLDLRAIGTTTGTGTKTILFNQAGGTYVNRGLVTITGGTTQPLLRWQADGTSLANEGSGTIRFSGTSVTTSGTLLGTATLRNEGLLEVLSTAAADATLVVTSPVDGATFAAGDLTEGRWRVVSGGSAATLSVTTTGTIRRIADSAVVTLDGSLASFTELERAGSELQQVLDGGRLNVRGGKSFTATADFSLENGGILQVGGTAGDGAEFRVGTAGTGTLDNAGLLLGHGAVRGSVVNGLFGSGTVSPGSSPGILTIDGDYDQYGDGILAIEIFSLGSGETVGTAGVNFDQLVVTGATNFAEPTTLALAFDAPGGAIDWNDEFWASSLTGASGWKILGSASATAGLGNLALASSYLDMNGVPLASVRPAASFSTQQVGTDVYLVYAVPEPSATFLAVVGSLLGGLAARRLRRR